MIKYLLFPQPLFDFLIHKNTIELTVAFFIFLKNFYFPLDS